MLRLNPVAEPYRLDLAPGVRVLVDPCSSALMVAARSSAEVYQLRGWKTALPEIPALWVRDAPDL